MRPKKTTLVLPVAAAAALAVPVASQAGGHTPPPPKPTPTTQQLKLLAWESKSDAAWQKKTWQKTRAWCMDKVNGAPRWRSVLQQG